MFGCIGNVEVRDHGYEPRQADYQRRERDDAVAAYEKALRGGAPRAVIAKGGRVPQVAHPAVSRGCVAGRRGVGERHRFARSSRQWMARFVLGGRPPLDVIEQHLAAACLAAIEHPSQCRPPALRCLAAIIGHRGHDLTSDALDKWGTSQP